MIVRHRALASIYLTLQGGEPAWWIIGRRSARLGEWQMEHVSISFPALVHRPLPHSWSFSNENRKTPRRGRNWGPILESCTNRRPPAGNLLYARENNSSISSIHFVEFADNPATTDMLTLIGERVPHAISLGCPGSAHLLLHLFLRFCQYLARRAR